MFSDINFSRNVNFSEGLVHGKGMDIIMSRYLMGIDGGATKTQCVLYNIDENKADLVRFGPLNHEVLPGGFEQLKIDLKSLIDSTLIRSNATIDQLEYCVFGMAGVDTNSQHNIVSEIIKDIGISNFLLCNDSFLGIKAGSPNGTGICVINGTGSTASGIDQTGKIIQIGGFGDLSGDMGGGTFIGIAVVRSVYKYLFKRGKPTIMKSLIFNTLGIKSENEFMEIITEKINNGDIKLSTLNIIAFDAARQGDETAINILTETGLDYADTVNEIINQLNFNETEEINIVLAGTVNIKEKNSLLVKVMKERILQTNQNYRINFVILQHPPVIGALIWAAEQAGIKSFSLDMIDNLKLI